MYKFGQIGGLRLSNVQNDTRCPFCMFTSMNMQNPAFLQGGEDANRIISQPQHGLESLVIIAGTIFATELDAFEKQVRFS